MLGIWKKQEIMLTSFTNLLLSKYKELFTIYIERNNTNKKHCPLNKKNKTPIG